MVYDSARRTGDVERVCWLLEGEKVRCSGYAPESSGQAGQGGEGGKCGLARSSGLAGRRSFLAPPSVEGIRGLGLFFTRHIEPRRQKNGTHGHAVQIVSGEKTLQELDHKLLTGAWVLACSRRPERTELVWLPRSHCCIVLTLTLMLLGHKTTCSVETGPLSPPAWMAPWCLEFGYVSRMEWFRRPFVICTRRANTASGSSKKREPHDRGVRVTTEKRR